MRIFVHPSVIPDLLNRSSRVKLLALPNHFDAATHEVDYLFEPTPIGRTPSADDQDRDLIKIVGHELETYRKPAESSPFSVFRDPP